MPWHVGEKTEKGWPIVRTDTGDVVGYSLNRWKAEASVRIRYEKTYGYVPEEFQRRTLSATGKAGARGKNSRTAKR